MIGNRLLTAMLLCGAFMEDQPPRRAPPPPKPPPEPDDRDPAKPTVDPVRYLELWIAEHGGASEEVLRKVLEDAYGVKTRGVEIGEHLPSQITQMLRETYDAPDVLTLPESSAHFATLRVDGADRYHLHGDPKQVEADGHQGNPFGKTTADLRRLTEGFNALGNAAAGASRIADDIPARAAEPYKPVFPARKTPYIPFYTPAELEERRAQAKAKKAKRKSAQASKRRNR